MQRVHENSQGTDEFEGWELGREAQGRVPALEAA